MTPMPDATAITFAHAARLAGNRLVFRKTLLLLLKTWKQSAGGLALLLLLRLMGGGWIGGGLAVTLVLLWVVGCAAWAIWKRPDGYSALAFWDRQTSRGDAFANAWWFEKQEEKGPGQEMHLSRQAKALPEAIGSLNKDIPLPDVRWVACIPCIAVGMLFLPDSGVIHLPDAPLTAAGRDLAVKEGRKLEDTKLDAEKLTSLTEEEKKEVEELKQQVTETAKALQESGAKTAREVLSELEKRARDAERLAAKLGAGDAAWASEEMVAEMRKHADTAELGDAVAEKSAERTAKEAEKIAAKLGDAALTNETRNRFAETLRDIGKSGQPEDKERTVGQHLLGADRQMTQTLPKGASKEFQELATKMKTLAAREKAREQLEKLAQQLRQTGSNIAGQGSNGMQQLAGSPGQQGQNNQGQNNPGQSQMQNLQNAPQMAPMQMPGMSSAPQSQQGMGSGQNMPVLTPVPGSPNPNQQPMAIGKPGSGQPPPPGGGKGQPMLIAPIPGTNPNQQPAAAILGMTPGVGQGGLQAGSGTAQPGNAPTSQTKPGQQVTVNAQRSAEGASSVRAVEGQARPEAAGRGSQATALDAIAAEENALDDAALPPARREQVRRYFTELRRRFEKE